MSSRFFRIVLLMVVLAAIMAACASTLGDLHPTHLRAPRVLTALALAACCLAMAAALLLFLLAAGRRFASVMHARKPVTGGILERGCVRLC
ncbi:MAG TPA: hypothetical protein VLT16_17720 [Candidatus Limnocylindrales bacterium]|nr:hypothetical protein [Candidatus Limnocylindrales bacterium]